MILDRHIWKNRSARLFWCAESARDQSEIEGM